MTVTLEQMITFIDEKVRQAKNAMNARLESAKDWDSQNDEDARGAARLASAMTGKAHAIVARLDRNRIAASERRIAARHLREVNVYEAIRDLLREKRAGDA